MVAEAYRTRAGDGRPALSVLLVAVAVVCLGVQGAVLPLWLLPQQQAWGWLLVPLALLTTPFWSLIHEAIHGTLLPHRRWNDRAGRILAVGYGAPFVLLKAGHLLHHRYSRTSRERTEVYDPADTSRAMAALSYYPRLLGGLYLAEVGSVLLAPAPRRLWRHLARRLESPHSVTGLVFDRIHRRDLAQFRLDAAAIVALHAAAAIAYGRHGWMLATAIAVRALIVSLADNAYHYGTRLDAPLEAMNLRLPRPLEVFALAFNLHAVHHRHPGLHWYQLRRAFQADGDRFHQGWFGAVARQLRGPIPATADGVRTITAAEDVRPATAAGTAVPT